MAEMDSKNKMKIGIAVGLLLIAGVLLYIFVLSPKPSGISTDGPTPTHTPGRGGPKAPENTKPAK